MDKLKTLNEIETYHGEFDKVRDIAVEWIKKDIETDGLKSMSTLLWMKRLDVTHEELTSKDTNKSEERDE